MKSPSSDPQLLDTLRWIGSAPPEIIELFDYVDDLLLWMKDAHGRYQWVNTPFLLAFDVATRAEIIGRSDFDFCSPVMANQYRIDDERVLKGERILFRVELLGRLNHTARWSVTSKIPLHDRKGRIVGTVGVTRSLDQDAPVPTADSPLSPAIRLVSQAYSESISNHQLAKACGLSVRAFERQFQADYQMSPHQYVRNLRVRMSCSALVFTRKPLAQIATDSGFADQSHFTKEFGRLMGETPRAYRLHYTRRPRG